MLVVLIFSGLPLVSRDDKHVCTDLIDNFLGKRTRQWLGTVIHLIVSVVLLGVTWLIWLKAGTMTRTGDTTATLHIPVYPFVYLMCFLILVTAIIHAMKALRGELGEGGGGNI